MLSVCSDVFGLAARPAQVMDGGGGESAENRGGTVRCLDAAAIFCRFCRVFPPLALSRSGIRVGGIRDHPLSPAQPSSPSDA